MARIGAGYAPMFSLPSAIAIWRFPVTLKTAEASNGIRDAVESAGMTPVIPPRSNRKTHICFDAELYKLRNWVGRCINKLKNARRLATRYDKTAASYLSFVEITAAKLWFCFLSA